MPNTTHHTIHNCVQSLFDTLIDISKGYAVLVERADPAVEGFIQDLADTHTRDIAEIEIAAKKQGVELDRSGTMMGEVHKAAVKVRDHISDIDSNALEAVADGEENVVKRYNSAIAETSEADELHNVLVTQRQELRGKIANIFEAV